MELPQSVETEAPKKVTKLFLNRPLGDRRVGFEPSGNIDRSICIEGAIEVLGDVADVRRREDVVQLPEGVIGRQRLHVEYIDRCASDSARLQRLDQGRLLDDRTP